ncbi:hypothetical protein ACRAWD_07910 [Caulobacter segnis]
MADRHAEGLKGAVISTPRRSIDGVSVWWLSHVIEHENRDGLARPPEDARIPTAVYLHPVPDAVQAPYAQFPRGAGGAHRGHRRRDGSWPCRCTPIWAKPTSRRSSTRIRAFNG